MRTRVRDIQGRLAKSEPHRTSAIEAADFYFAEGLIGSAATILRLIGR